jgi:hypothetical protein
MANGDKSASRMRRLRASRREQGYREYNVLVSPDNFKKLLLLIKHVGVSPTNALEGMLEHCFASLKMPRNGSSVDTELRAIADAIDMLGVSPKPTKKKPRKRQHK